MQPISVVIPFYQDTDVLFANLKKNKKHLIGCELVIVNDSPELDIGPELKKIVPDAKLVVNRKNVGFSLTVNAGVLESTREFVLLLNMDVVLADSAFVSAIKRFESDNLLFAVSFAQKEKNGTIVGANEGYFESGMFHHRAKKTDAVCENLWPEGGSCIIRKSFFITIGGYDRIYSPFYWEDVDLGYRAMQQGWHTIYDPGVLVEHHHETVIGTHFPSTQIKTIATRNQFLFIWKNIRGFKLVWHIMMLPKILLSQRNNPYFIAGFKAALLRFLVTNNA